MLFKDRKELADKYKIWVKQSIDNNQTMILDCAESLIAFLDLNGYLNKIVHGEWIVEESEVGGCSGIAVAISYVCSICSTMNEYKDNFCPHCGADMRGNIE